jgi:diacylglycerol kinase (ATP)
VTGPPIVLVVNPRAGRNRVARELPRLLRLLASMGVDADVRQTQAEGHATALARAAALSGARTVVAVGGDGTINEVVNGLLDGDGSALGPSLGVVAAGSGCDFARSFELPRHVDSDLRGIAGPTVRLDVGRLECRGTSGTVIRHFVNVAEAGMAASTVALAERLPRWLGRSRYLVAFWPTLARYRPTRMTVATAGGRHEGVAHNALVANARFFGGGMHISPGSNPTDGSFEVQVNVGPKRQALTLLPRIYRGRHLPDERIVQLAGDAVSIDSDTPVPVEADGELVGTTPLRVTVLPGALELVA